MENNNLHDLLNEPSEVQLAVIATKLFYIEDKVNCIDRKVSSLMVWKIKMGAVAATIGALVSIGVTFISKLL